MKAALVSVLTFTFFIVSNFSQAVGDYRSINSGTWATVGIWEKFTGVWGAAPSAPTSTDGVITIQSGHTVQITAAVSLDQVVINSGGMINWTGGTCTFVNGAGVDLQIDGTFWDNRGVAGTSITFTASTWQMGANGTLLRSAGNSSNNWQAAYQGGIATIPATSNWILRKTTAGQNPALSSTTPATGSVYPNLTLENTTGTAWSAASFSGFSAPQIIKGNLDIGGAGAGAGVITFGNTNTHANQTLVQGNVIVRANHVYQNNGTGTEIRGNLTVNGTFSYGGAAGRNLTFSGGNAQSIINPGTLSIYNFTINKSANTLTLNNPITVDNLATFTNGIVNSSNPNFFIFNTAATVAAASNTSFVNGPVRRLGGTGIIFPVGKVASYRPIGLGNGAGGGTFWTEDFGTSTSCGADQNQVVNSYVGVNGAWTLTTTTNGGSGNQFFVSATEAGMGAAACGNGCLANGALLNRTLHVGNVPSSPAAFFFCPTGDCGAAYDAGLADGSVLTDRRAESPTINCTGKSNISVNIEYIESGQGASDNALLWYFDGVSWTMLVDMAKTPAGGCGTQGTWTSFTQMLPVSANNNPAVKIGFQWINNDDGAGSDPSFAVDNITLAEINGSVFTAEYFPSNPQIPYGNILVPTLTALSDCEYWILDRNAGTDSRTVTLSWNAASCYASAFASFQVARHDGISTWQDHDGTPIGSAAGGTITTPLAVTSFSPFAIAYVPLPLPIELLQFNGTCENGIVQLNWQTATETNNDYFTVEKSSDMQTWADLRTLDGAGNSNIVLSYATTDLHPFGTSYYRLKQTDYDGKVEIFEPISIHCDNQNYEINIYPNPTTGLVNISIPNGSVLQSIQIFTSLGQSVMNVITGDVKGGVIQTIDLSQLQSGTYYLKLQIDNNFVTKPINIIK